MESEEFSTERLVEVLNILCENIKNGNVDIEIQKDLWSYLFWDKHNPQNKEMVKYLFMGWYITQLGITNSK